MSMLVSVRVQDLLRLQSAAVASAGPGGQGGPSPASLASVDFCDPAVNVQELLQPALPGLLSPPYSNSSGTSNAPLSNIQVANASSITANATLSGNAVVTSSPESLAAASAALTQLFSEYGMVLGTATDAPYTNLLEPALIPGSALLGAATGGSSTGGGSGGNNVFGGSGGGSSLTGGHGGSAAFNTRPDQVRQKARIRLC